MNASSLINFIEDYKRFSKRTENERFEHDKMRFSHLFSGFNAINTLLKEEEQKHASQFNIFKILKGSERLEEKTHSPILGNLLDPRGTHCQGELFYSKFLSEISNCGVDTKKFSPQEYSSVFVELEKYTTHGNLDILITNRFHECRFAILIENKIYAVDQHKQLERYYDYLQNSDFKNNFLLIYLTVSGYPPSEMSINKNLYEELLSKKRLINLSYKNSIVNMLNSSIPHIQAENVRAIVNQYLQTIKKL